MRMVFSNVEHILPINEALLDMVKERIDTWSDTQVIGDIFVKFVCFYFSFFIIISLKFNYLNIILMIIK